MASAENAGRFVLFPIKYHDIWKKYNEAESNILTTEEIDLSADMSGRKVHLSVKSFSPNRLQSSL
jgi:ribonucleotide reductase beta subunit family protein with ferritin-like domain